MSCDADADAPTPLDSPCAAPAVSDWPRPHRGNHAGFVLLALAALATAAGCGAESTQLLVTDPAASDTTAEIVASRMDITRLADVASDGFVIQLLAELPPEKVSQATGAVEEFGATVLAEPGESFKGLQTALVVLDDESELDQTEDSDAGIAHGVLDLYLDWSHVTLFGTEADSGPSPR